MFNLEIEDFFYLFNLQYFQDKLNFPTANYYNSSSDYQLIYGERFISFFPNRLKAANEAILSEQEFSNYEEYSVNCDKSQKREPWNNAF